MLELRARNRVFGAQLDQTTHSHRYSHKLGKLTLQGGF